LIRFVLIAFSAIRLMDKVGPKSSSQWPCVEISKLAIGGASIHVRDITVKRRSDGQFQNIPDASLKYLPLMYPLLFLNVEDGWHQDILMASRSDHLDRRAPPSISGCRANTRLLPAGKLNPYTSFQGMVPEDYCCLSFRWSM
jgi:hypothetical protein